MSGATLKDLSEYHQSAMQYFKNGLVSEQNRLYAQTEDAGAVSFWPLGGTPLEGKVKFSFKETPPASGDKGPENPSAIAGVESVNVIKCGKNLIPYPWTHSSRTINGISFTVNADGSVLANGTATAATVFWLNSTVKRTIFYPNITYKIHGKATDSNGSSVVVGIDLYSFVSTPVYKKTYSNIDSGSTSFTLDDKYYARQYIKIANGQNVQNLLFYPQIEASSIKTDYEIPDFTQLTVALGSTYYGGEIDLATGVMTVTWFEHTFDGTEVFHFESTDYETCSRIGTTLSGTAPAPATQVLNTSGVAACTHYPHRFDWGDRVQVSFHSSGFIRFFTPLTIASTAAELQAFFAQQYANGTPVKLTYPVKNPTTVQLTPTQALSLAQQDKYTPRLNTVYTDADSIQIRYRKSLIHDEDEKVQAIVALGGNV